jgi:hypothetical protein
MNLKNDSRLLAGYERACCVVLCWVVLCSDCLSTKLGVET